MPLRSAWRSPVEPPVKIERVDRPPATRPARRRRFGDARRRDDALDVARRSRSPRFGLVERNAERRFDMPHVVDDAIDAAPLDANVDLRGLGTRDEFVAVVHSVDHRHQPLVVARDRHRNERIAAQFGDSLRAVDGVDQVPGGEVEVDARSAPRAPARAVDAAGRSEPKPNSRQDRSASSMRRSKSVPAMCTPWLARMSALADPACARTLRGRRERSRSPRCRRRCRRRAPALVDVVIDRAFVARRRRRSARTGSTTSREANAHAAAPSQRRLGPCASRARDRRRQRRPAGRAPRGRSARRWLLRRGCFRWRR